MKCVKSTKTVCVGHVIELNRAKLERNWAESSWLLSNTVENIHTYSSIWVLDLWLSLRLWISGKRGRKNGRKSGLLLIQLVCSISMIYTLLNIVDVISFWFIERPEEPYDNRSLFDRLQEQKQKKDLEYEEAHKLSKCLLVFLTCKSFLPGLKFVESFN